MALLIYSDESATAIRAGFRLAVEKIASILQKLDMI